MAINVAGMLAQSGQNIGQSIGAPIQKFGEGLGSMLGARQQKQREQEEQNEVKQLLQKYANNPEQLNALGTNAAAEGNDQLSKVFFNAAKMAVDKDTKNATRGVQGGLAAITQAASRGVPLADLREARGSVLGLGGTNEQIMKAYKDGVELNKKPEEKDLSLTTESVVETDPETGKLVVNQYRIGYNKSTGAEVSRQLIGRDKDQGKAPDDTRSITELLIEAGVPEDKIDLNTIEGLQVARTLVVDKVQNASLANTLTSMIEEKTPPGVGDAFELLVKIDPEFVSAQEDVARVEKFKALSELSSEDMSGLKNLLERVVSGTTESDVRAVSELQQFRGDKDLINKFNDFVLGVTSGRLSQETIQEYGTIMEVVGELAKKHQINTLDALIVSGSAREAEAASKALDFITRGEGTARVIPNS
jgi:hypothetical protein